MSSSGIAFRALALAIVKGFLRDRTALFFSVIFPLMFLVIFGGLLGNQGQSKIDLVVVGDSALIDQLPPEARTTFEETFDVTSSDSLSAAVAQVRRGDADVAVETRGDTVIAHYTRTDPAQAATTAAALRAYVDGTNIALSGQPPRFSLETEAVEDDALKPIQYYTPGLLGWAVAMSAALGAAATLQGWRQTKMLRRLQLAPVSTRTVVAARVVVTVGIALGQLAVFTGVAVALFGLRLSGAWWMSVPLLVVGTLSFMAVGLLAGALAKTTEGAVNFANFIVLPMSFLSGSFFPLDGSPRWLQVLSSLLPLRHLNDGMLDVMVRGEGPAAALAPMGILAAFALVLTLLAARLFRWDAA